MGKVISFMNNKGGVAKTMSAFNIENVDFVPADLKLSNFDAETSHINLKVYLLKDLIAPVKDNYDYIVIDCPPALGSIIMNAMVASDGIVLVSTPDQPSLDGMHMIVGVYNEVLADDRLNPYLRFIGCLITRVENDTINKSYIGQIEEEFGAYVIKPFIRKNTKLNQSVSFRKDIFSYDPKDRGAKEYRDAGKEILIRIEQD